MSKEAIAVYEKCIASVQKASLNKSLETTWLFFRFTVVPPKTI